eukprot:TRINITY_DN1292_c0_g1_i5.p1 TRINITY_DN1292_c0_g1~~TRINITY_DN1292_c0_g1_i5.p1  ORF type:complete len:1036 (-),score=274.94 TRINITY_DN1292_c0_g1_i5:72-3179(-)
MRSATAAPNARLFGGAEEAEQQQHQKKGTARRDQRQELLELLLRLLPPDYSSERGPTLAECCVLANITDAQAVATACYHYDAAAAERLGLTREEAAALELYTYSQEGADRGTPRDQINSILMRSLPAELKHARAVIFLLLSALAKLPRVTASTDSQVPLTLCRGTSRKVDTASKYKQGNIVTWHGFNSATTEVAAIQSRLTDRATGKCEGTLFVIKCGWGYDLGKFTSASQKEIVLEPGSQFKVVSVLNVVWTVVELEMLPHPQLLKTILAKVATVACPDHKCKKLSVFCSDCRQAACSRCFLFGRHQGHTCWDMPKAQKELHAQAILAFTALDVHTGQIKERHTIISKELEVCKEEEKMNTDRIKQFFKRLRTELSQKEAAMLRQVQDEQAPKEHDLTARITSLSDWLRSTIDLHNQKADISRADAAAASAASECGDEWSVDCTTTALASLSCTCAALTSLASAAAQAVSTTHHASSTALPDPHFSGTADYESLEVAAKRFGFAFAAPSVAPAVTPEQPTPQSPLAANRGKTLKKTPSECTLAALHKLDEVEAGTGLSECLTSLADALHSSEPPEQRFLPAAVVLYSVGLSHGVSCILSHERAADLRPHLACNESTLHHFVRTARTSRPEVIAEGDAIAKQLLLTCALPPPPPPTPPPPMTPEQLPPSVSRPRPHVPPLVFPTVSIGHCSPPPPSQPPPAPSLLPPPRAAGQPVSPLPSPRSPLPPPALPSPTPLSSLSLPSLSLGGLLVAAPYVSSLLFSPGSLPQRQYVKAPTPPPPLSPSPSPPPEVDTATAAELSPIPPPPLSPPARTESLLFVGMWARCVQEDAALAIRIFQQLSVAGDASGSALNQLARCYLVGAGVTKDPAWAVGLFQRAVDAGHPGARTNLAWCYHFACGVVSRDVVRAVALYASAAEAGSPVAANNLAVCYETGDGVTKDECRAVALFQQGADAGYPSAMHNLARCYMQGLGGLTADPAAAVKLYERAAAMGHAEAMRELARCYKRGTGGLRQDQQRARLLRQQADATTGAGSNN